MSGYIKEDILRAASELGFHVSETDESESNSIRRQLQTKFFRQLPVAYWWEGLDYDQCTLVRNADAWRLIGEYVRQSRVLMLFDYDDDASVIVLDDGSNLVPILDNTFRFEFYLTNLEAEFLICFTHHDVLIACGSARSWLQKYKV